MQGLAGVRNAALARCKNQSSGPSTVDSIPNQARIKILPATLYSRLRLETGASFLPLFREIDLLT